MVDIDDQYIESALSSINIIDIRYFDFCSRVAAMGMQRSLSDTCQAVAAASSRKFEFAVREYTHVLWPVEGAGMRSLLEELCLIQNRSRSDTSHSRKIK